MSRNTRQKLTMQQSAIVFTACAGLLTATIVSGESNQEALDEAKQESPHQQEIMKDPRREAMEEAERESPHQRELQELSGDPGEEALEEDKRERP